MSRAFGRVAKATAYWPPAGIVGAHPDFFERLDNGLEIVGLDMSFVIEKKLVKDPNSCELTIINCSDSTRARLQKKPLTIRLEAGHDFSPRFMYLGSLKFGQSLLASTEWTTKLQLQDGGRAFAYATVPARTYSAGTPLRTIVADVAKAMGLVMPANVDASPELSSAIKTGTVLDGKAHDEMTRLLARFGYSWSIQNGKLQILRDGQATETRAWVIDRDAGIIGTPSYDAPDDKGNPPVLSFRTLLFPELSPGGKVDMNAPGIQGVHRIRELKHTGNTAGQEWYTDVKATRV